MEATASANTVWASVLERIRENCTPQQFQTWFTPLTPGTIQGIDLEGSEVSDNGSERADDCSPQLELIAPNQFLKDTLLRKNYIRLIEESASSVTGKPTTVSLRVTEEKPAFEATEFGHPTIDKERLPAPNTAREERPGVAQNGSGTTGFTSESPIPARPPEARVPGQLTSSASELNPNYSFQNFIVGPSNRVPHAAALAVVSSPGVAYNPLFLHGSVGLGKTHLLQAICHAMLQRKKIERFLYLSCETFVNHFISAIGNGKLEDFRYYYRHVDMLLIDDVQFLSKKERTQEEFFHTFNTLYNSQKQIVLTCDSPPSELSSIQERLVSRFNWGLVTHVQLPDYETRVAIIKNKAALMEFDLPEEVAHYTAERIESNIRDLEGAITKIVAYARLTKREADLSLAHEAFSDIRARKKVGPSMDDILGVITSHFGVKKSDLQSKRRLKSFTYPRQICMYLARNMTDMSLEEIGTYFGGRDHTTVMYAADKIGKLVEDDHDTAYLTEELAAQIRR